MPGTPGRHPGFRVARDARSLCRPPARQTRPKNRLLGPAERRVRRSWLTIRLGPLADGHFAQFRGHWANRTADAGRAGADPGGADGDRGGIEALGENTATPASD